MRALCWFFIGFFLLIAITWIGVIEEVLDFIPEISLRMIVNQLIWLAYLPMIVGLERFRRAIK